MGKSIPKTPAEALERIKKAAKEGKVEFVPTDNADDYSDEIIELLSNIIGERRAKRAFVSNESTIGHFLSDDEEKATLELLSNKYGFHIQRADLVWEVAKKIKER